MRALTALSGFCDLVGRIGELIDLFARADSLLAQALDSPLSVATLGRENRRGEQETHEPAG